MRLVLITIILSLITITAAAQKEATVYFDFDQSILTDDARSTLDSIAVSKRIAAIEIFGHCDQLGTKNYNYRLSEKRAAEVRNYLVWKGIDDAKIKILKGLGEDVPVIDKLDERSRQANRRVTINTFFALDTIAKVVEPVKPIVQAPTPTPTAPPIPRVRKENLLDEILDTTTKEGQNIILKNINFHGGSHRFLPIAYKPLDELLDVMQKIPTLVIEIQGHICCRDDQKDGWDYDSAEPFLSYNRARAVYTFLLRNGIDRTRMTYKGFARRHPIVDVERNETERTINRRVEIKIIKK